MTDQQKHTPGPWKFGFESASSDWAIVTDASGGVVANVNAESGPDAISAPATRKMPREANARLIAAAPDLLAACQKIVDAVEDGDEMAAIEMARAASAKATGA